MDGWKDLVWWGRRTKKKSSRNLETPNLSFLNKKVKKEKSLKEKKFKSLSEVKTLKIQE